MRENTGADESFGECRRARINGRQRFIKVFLFIQSAVIYGAEKLWVRKRLRSTIDCQANDNIIIINLCGRMIQLMYTFEWVMI